MQAYVNHFSHLNILYNDWNFYEALYFLKTGSQWHITATFSSLVIVFFFHSLYEPTLALVIKKSTFSKKNIIHT